MTFSYRNCLATITEIAGAHHLTIQFGESTLSDTLSAQDMEAAQEQAKDHIDLFIADLPAALSFKN